MPKINVYLPEDLADAVRESGIPVSSVCQEALERAVREVTAVRAATVAPTEVSRRGPFRRFTARAWRSLELAETAARRQGSAEMETEHVLLGIIDEGGNLGLRVIMSLEVEPEDLKNELIATTTRRGKSPKGAMPLSASVKRALEMTTTESQQLSHNYIGCEHILLGLIATEEGVASQILRRFGIDLRVARRSVQAALAGFVHARQNPGSDSEAAAPVLMDVLRRIEAIERRLSADA